MSRITLILGGARSGKSDFAEELAKGYSKVAFIATAKPLDDEMALRIANHRSQRPSSWTTFETGFELAKTLKEAASFKIIILDCLTIFVANCMEEAAKRGIDSSEFAKDALSEALDFLKDKESELIVVSNEVGAGLVPDNLLGRNYRDILGRFNQVVAKEAENVYLMVASVPLKVKG